MKIGPMFPPLYTGQVEVVKVETDLIALIDADRYKHLVTYRMYKEIMEEGKEHSKALLNEIIDNYLSRDIFNVFKAKTYVFCFSAPSKDVFRHAIAQEKKYKGNRGKSVDKYFYTGKYDDMGYVYDYIASRYQTLFFDDLEADDILSMLQDDRTFIFSHDKDLKQVKGMHWDMENYKLVNTTETEGTRILVLQLLLGDSGDNIPGLKGFGEKALNDFKEKVIRENMTTAQMLFHAITEYTNKYGVLYGIDAFAENWGLLSMKLNRGKYFKEKYVEAYSLMETLHEN
jgi:5'-3' exonuclease